MLFVMPIGAKRKLWILEIIRDYKYNNIIKIRGGSIGILEYKYHYLLRFKNIK